MKLINIILIYISLMNTINSQEWHNILAEWNDLPTGKVHETVIDNNNVKWIRTEKGLVSFDGQNWVRHNPFGAEIDMASTAGSPITDMEGNNSNTIWIADKDSGLAKYDGIQWQIFRSKEYADLRSITSLEIDNNNILYFVKDHSELFIFDNGMVIPVISSASMFIFDIEFDSNNRCWIGTQNGLYNYYEGQLEKINEPDVSNIRMNTLFIKDDVIYCGTSDGYFLSYADSAWHTHFNVNLKVNSITYDLNKFWISCEIGLFEYSDSTLVHYNNFNSPIACSFIYNVTVDQEHNKWISTPDGLSVLSEDGWYEYDASYGLPSNLLRDTAIDSDGALWIGASDGLVKYCDGEWELFKKYNSGLPMNTVSTICIDSASSLWFGTVNGVAKYDGEAWQNYNMENTPLTTNKIRLLETAPSGNIWIISYNEIVIYKDNQWIVFNSTNSPLPEEYIWDVKFRDEECWVSTKEGLLKFQNNEWELFNSENSGLPFNDTYRLIFDNDRNLWIGFEHPALCKYDGADWTTFTPENSSFPYDHIASMAIDIHGSLWIGFYWGAGLAKVENNTFTQYNNYFFPEYPNQGLGFTDISIDRWNNFWLCGGPGLFTFSENEIIMSIENNNYHEPENIFTRNYPNPFNSSTRIKFSLPVSSNVDLTIYDIMGQEIKTQISNNLPAGNHNITWNGTNKNNEFVSSGIYIYRLQAVGDDGRSFSKSAKMILLK